MDRLTNCYVKPQTYTLLYTNESSFTLNKELGGQLAVLALTLKTNRNSQNKLGLFSKHHQFELKFKEQKFNKLFSEICTYPGHYFLA